MAKLYVRDIKKQLSSKVRPEYISFRADIKKPWPDYRLTGPAYCRPGRNNLLIRLGQLILPPGWAGGLLSG
jgi:hypothetical protein